MEEESGSNGGLLSLLEPTNSCDITIGPNCVDGNLVNVVITNIFVERMIKDTNEEFYIYRLAHVS